MSLRLTNTLSRRTEPFTPLTPGKVSIYCCGVTVYDLCHLGHARSYINWDVLRRFLIWRGLEVTFVQNFTDIDDKILKRAAEQETSTGEVSERNIEVFFQDMDALETTRKIMVKTVENPTKTSVIVMAETGVGANWMEAK